MIEFAIDQRRKLIEEVVGGVRERAARRPRPGVG